MICWPRSSLPTPSHCTPEPHCHLAPCSMRRWGAFALALILSLGSAIPIVYFCRLPECGRHAAAAVLAGGAAVARAFAK